jgi:hypothetical protein
MDGLARALFFDSEALPARERTKVKWIFVASESAIVT